VLPSLFVATPLFGSRHTRARLHALLPGQPLPDHP
jgi:hypothetical protein